MSLKIFLNIMHTVNHITTYVTDSLLLKFSLILVENLTALVNDQCNAYTSISWILRGDSVMLTDVNFTITITDSMGNVNRTIIISASDCVHNIMTCGEYLTEFNYTSVDGLEQNEPYNVSIRTSINEINTMHIVRTPVVSIMANTTIPGKNIISQYLLVHFVIIGISQIMCSLTIVFQTLCVTGFDKSRL